MSPESGPDAKSLRPVRIPTAILGALSLASLVLGRGDPTHLFDVFGIGCALVAFGLWHGRARSRVLQDDFLRLGLLVVIVTGPLLALSAVAHLGPFEPRKEDAFEPNDTYATATPLKAGTEIIAMVLQRTSDVFSLDAPAGSTIVFKLRSLGHEDCAAFEVMGPRETVLYRDAYGFCERRTQTQAAGVSISGHYELRIPAEAAGTYFLTIWESQNVDNMFPYAWKYGLTGLIE